MLSPQPPPVGGIATWTRAVLSSPITNEFEFVTVNTAPPDHDDVKSVSLFRLNRAWSALRILWLTLSALIVQRPDLIHIHTSYHWAMVRDAIVIWMAWAFGVPRILHLHGGNFPSFAESLPAPLGMLLRATLRRVNCIVSITRETEAYLAVRYGADQIRYLPNFLGHDSEPTFTSGKGSGQPRPRVLYVGWLIEAKGIPELIAAAARLPEADFELIGPYSEEYEPTLNRLLDAAGGHIRLLGPAEHARVLKCYAAADIFVLPSRNEGFPMVLLEAMAAGLPIVSTRVGAIEDMVRDGVDGYLVDAKDTEELANRLRRLIEDKALRQRMGNSAAQNVRDCFGFGVVAEQLRAIYFEFASGTKRETQ
jgi:glycosyltransferase involved in cell wall biosynthesis